VSDGRVLSIAAARRGLAAGDDVELVYARTLPWCAVSDQRGFLDVSYATSRATEAVYDAVSFGPDGGAGALPVGYPRGRCRAT
jgi:hypothetical protein